MRKNRALITKVRRAVLAHYELKGRHSLLWRKTNDPYRILVSEVMLQQTQVARVTEKYREFIKAFPTIGALSRASTADILRVWSGMGYNRRALYLRNAAQEIVKRHKGKVPRDYALLRLLPGVGDYTARAIRIFAFNEQDHLIETNIRAVLIYYFFKTKKEVSDSLLVPLAEDLARGLDPRTWHSALMDYGVHIKALHQNPSRKSSVYKKQSPFKGSIRETRGALLRVLQSTNKREKIESEFRTVQNFEKALNGLVRDGLVRVTTTTIKLA